jgi:Na+/H+-translocating membrane pyrophosphatase
VGSFDLLNRLPFVFYVLAVIVGFVVLMSMSAAKELSGAEIGALIGYTVGSVLSMFAVGRVIQLLHQIRDSVRNTPALSPGRPDDE